MGHFEITEQIRKVACRLALSPDMSAVNNVFHVYMLKKYVPEPSHVLTQE